MTSRVPAASLALALVLLAPGRPAAQTPAVGQVQRLAPDVYFHQGDISKGHCNNGWVIFEDYVLVIDANYPSGAREIIPKIRELTDKPIRFAFDTHHHGDHAYGNQVWADEGATPVAHTAVLDELKRLDTGQFGGAPGRWEGEAKNREDLRASKLKPPTLLFPDTLIFDDGRHRVELRHFGPAHTKGDGFAWLPNEKILFTGDAVVNGAYNFVGDGDTGAWVTTLERAAALGATVVGPGHGPLATGALVGEQRRYFAELRRVVRAAVEKGTGAEVQAAIPGMRAQLGKDAAIAKYLGDGFPAQVAKVYSELTGRMLPDRRPAQEARRRHERSHGHDHASPPPAAHEHGGGAHQHE